MKITYASHHKWSKPVVGDNFPLFGKNNQNRLHSTLNNIENTNITHEFSPLTNETLNWFIPLYQETISTKTNPKIFDIRDTTINKNSIYKYYSLVLFENNVAIGATIFSERDTILSIAYRIYPNNWVDNKLRAGPSFYAEYLLNSYASQKGFKLISHGRDRNPYGLNSHIGLAIFKLTVGCTASLLNSSYEVKNIDLDEIDRDVLIFKHPTESRQITEGVLYASEENVHKYTQVTKYPEKLLVETIIRKIN